MPNEAYKSWHQPKRNQYQENGKLKKGQTYQGFYNVQNPSKYFGNPGQVIFRSSWEMAFCKFCDMSPSVVKWSSEPIKVPYYDRVSKLDECYKYGLDPNNPANWLVRNYNTDYWMEVDQGDGTTKKMFIEIKPAEKLQRPKPPAENASIKEKRNFNIRAKEYLINEAKFAALNAWAEKTGVKFYVLTEHTLARLIGRFWNEIEQK